MMLLFCIGPINSASAENPQPAKGSTEELYQDIFLTLLDPYIQEAVNDYYEKYFKDVPQIAPYFHDVLSVYRPNGDRTPEFVIKLRVLPYFGPHNSVGVDHITLSVSAGSKVRIEKFEHIKSYALPPNYRNEVIGQWPPD